MPSSFKETFFKEEKKEEKTHLLSMEEGDPVNDEAPALVVIPEVKVVSLEEEIAIEPVPDAEEIIKKANALKVKVEKLNAEFNAQLDSDNQLRKEFENTFKNLDKTPIVFEKLLTKFQIYITSANSLLDEYQVLQNEVINGKILSQAELNSIDDLWKQEGYKIKEANQEFAFRSIYQAMLLGKNKNLYNAEFQEIDNAISAKEEKLKKVTKAHNNRYDKWDKGSEYGVILTLTAVGSVIGIPLLLISSLGMTIDRLVTKIRISSLNKEIKKLNEQKFDSILEIQNANVDVIKNPELVAPISIFQAKQSIQIANLENVSLKKFKP